MKAENYGEWAFLAGVGLSVIIGVASSLIGASMPLVLGVLALLGLIVGLMNIHDKEVTTFLIATIALLGVLYALQPIIVVISTVGNGGTLLGTWVNTFLSALAAFISPAAFIVALKAVHGMAKE